MLQGTRNLLKQISHHSFLLYKNISSQGRYMTNEQLIFHIYGSHCEKYIYICGTWGPFYNHSGSILLLSSPFTNINIHVNNPKYDFCSCLGGPGPFAESKVPKCQRIKTSSQWRRMYNKENDQLFIYGPRCENNEQF